MRQICCLMASLMLLTIAAATAQAKTIAYWRFEEGTADSNVAAYGVIDETGNGNKMNPKTVGDASGYVYKADVANSALANSLAPNNLSIREAGATTSIYTDSPTTNPSIDVEDTPYLAWTIEASFKAEAGAGDRNIVGRDSLGVNTQANGAAAANPARPSLYLIATGNNGAAIRFTDAAGYFHVANSAADVVQRYPAGTDGADTPWYHLAAICDGTSLRLYLAQEGQEFQLVAETDLTASGSLDTQLSAGKATELASNNPNGVNYTTWHGGGWTVGRGLWNGAYASHFRGFIDEVRISDEALPLQQLLAYQKLRAWNPSPASGATGVDPTSVTFSWNARLNPSDPDSGPDPRLTYHRLYLQSLTNPNNYVMHQLAASGDTGSYTTTLDFDIEDYRWRVDQVVNDPDPNVITGPTWTLDTTPSSPVIVTQPAALQVVREGQDASFTIVVESLTAPSYQWMRVNPAGDDLAIGIDSDTLVVPTVSMADEGHYYCIVTNQNPEAQPVTSNLAGLAVARRLAWWPLDGDFLDYSGHNHDADPNGTPTFIAGADGTDPGAAVVKTGAGWADSGAWNPSELSGQFSASFWLYWNGPDQTWDVFVAKRFGDMAPATAMWQVNNNWNNGDMLMFQCPTVSINVDDILQPRAWQHIVVTYDGANGTIYFNGIEQLSAAFTPGNATDAPLTLGAAYEGAAGEETIGSFANGALDDIQIFNYALSEIEVAQLFNAVTGQSVCLEGSRPDAALDLDGNCIVDLLDFSQFMDAWLDCGLLPDCIPATP